MEFLTSDYEMTYGQTPRGRGSWAFSPDKNPDVLDKEKVFWTPGSTTYQEAKKLASAWAKSKGHNYLFVLT
jgi:hypothetical protein